MCVIALLFRTDGWLTQDETGKAAIKQAAKPPGASLDNPILRLAVTLST
jgi:hypothetical protein